MSDTMPDEFSYHGYVPGLPTSKGSGEGTEVMRASSGRAVWRDDLTHTFRRVRADWNNAHPDLLMPFTWQQLPAGIFCELVFWLPRPRSGLQSDQLMRRPVKPPDSDKLVRMVRDEATEWLWTDDALVTWGIESKWWGTPGARAAGVAFRLDVRPDEEPPAWSLLAPTVVPELAPLPQVLVTHLEMDFQQQPRAKRRKVR